MTGEDKDYILINNSMREFITGSNYLGNIKVDVISKYETPEPTVLYKACIDVLKKVSNSQTVSLEWFSQKYSNNKWALRDPFSFAKLKGHLNLVLRQPPFFRLFSYRSQIRNLLQYRSNNI